MPGDDILSAYDYELPPGSIAQRPLATRDSSRLMVVDRGGRSVSHRRFCDLPQLLIPGDLLIVNDTRVIPARLTGYRETTGGRVELLLLHRIEQNTWSALARPAKRLKPGVRIMIDGHPALEITGMGDGGRRTVTFIRPEQEILGRGEVPLPPYITEPLSDSERYQTVYARAPGSAAAPTAGLHFTPRLLDVLRTRGVEVHAVTLHVGPDTFVPIRTEDIREHHMHSEYFTVGPETAAALASAAADGRRVVAAGTTAVRALESLPRLAGTLTAYEGWTSLFIAPGFRFRVVSAMITNFHLPRSTLLVLVAAFSGREFILDAYREAIARGYRFYSFGDAMLIQ